MRNPYRQAHLGGLAIFGSWLLRSQHVHGIGLSSAEQLNSLEKKSGLTLPFSLCRTRHPLLCRSASLFPGLSYIY
jgi:hypothetical protein